MKKKQLLAVLGSIFLFGGVFAPVISLPILGSFNYFQNGRGNSICILVLASISLILALTSHYEALWLTAGLSLSMLTFKFVQLLLLRQQLSTMDDGLASNPFGSLLRLAVNSVQIEWGWTLLVFSVGLLLASAALKDVGNSTNSFLSLRAKFFSIIGVVTIVAIGTWVSSQTRYGETASIESPERTQADEAKRRKGLENAAEKEYLPKVKIYEIVGGYSYGTMTCTELQGRKCQSFTAKVKNEGGRPLGKVSVTAYFPDKDGKVVFEKDYSPILVIKRDFSPVMGGNNDPLKPGYIREFGYVIEDCPSECVPQNVRVEVTTVKFSDAGDK